MLIVLLALPAFFFLFLKQFGVNHYDLPYFYPLTDSDGNVLFEGPDTAYYRIEESLGLDDQGDTVRADFLDDRVSFFFLRSREREETVKQIEAENRIIEKLNHADEVVFLVDREWRGDVKASDRKIVSLAGGDDGAFPWGRILKTESDVSRTFSKNVSLVLVDGSRRIRGYYNISDPDDFDRAVAEARILIYQKEINQ